MKKDALYNKVAGAFCNNTLMYQVGKFETVSYLEINFKESYQIRYDNLAF